MTPTDNLEAGAGDLVERLQAGIPYEYDASENRMVSDISGMDDLMSEAAAQLAAVTAENARLREALKWFVDRSQPIQAKFALHGPKDTADAMVDAFRAARAALSQEAPNGER